eukprot:134615_1
MVPPIVKFITPILLITVIKSYSNTSDPSTIFWFRMIFGIGQTLIISALLYVRFLIPSHPDATQKVRVTQKQLNPPSPFDLFGTKEETKEDNKIIKMSVLEYDSSVWNKKFKQTCMTVTIIPLMHYFLGIVVPLVMSVALNVMGLLDDPLYRIYVRNHSTTRNKELVRPFKFSNPMDNIKKMTESWMPAEPGSEEKDKTEATETTNVKANSKPIKKGNRRRKKRKM